MSYGQDSTVALCFQNSYGTALTNSPYWISHISESFAVTKEQLIAQGMRGLFYEGDHYEGMNACEGDLETEAHPITVGAILQAALGSPTTVQSGNIYTHTFNPVTTDFDQFAANPPVTIVKDLNDGGSAHLYYDMVAANLTLSVANGEFLKAKIGFMGGKYSQTSALTASYPTGKSNWTWDVASMSMGGAAQVDIAALNVVLEESLENRYTMNGAKTPSRTKRSGFRVVTFDGTLIFENQTEYQQFLAQSERELDVLFRGTTEIQSGYYEELRIQLPGARYGEFKPVAGGAGIIEVSFSGKGVYNVNSATGMRITLVNTQPAY